MITPAVKSIEARRAPAGLADHEYMVPASGFNGHPQNVSNVTAGVLFRAFCDVRAKEATITPLKGNKETDCRRWIHPFVVMAPRIHRGKGVKLLANASEFSIMRVMPVGRGNQEQQR